MSLTTVTVVAENVDFVLGACPITQAALRARCANRRRHTVLCPSPLFQIANAVTIANRPYVMPGLNHAIQINSLYATYSLVWHAVYILSLISCGFFRWNAIAPAAGCTPWNTPAGRSVRHALSSCIMWLSAKTVVHTLSCGCIRWLSSTSQPRVQYCSSCNVSAWYFLHFVYISSAKGQTLWSIPCG